MELSAVIVFSLVLGCIMDGYAETMPTALSRRKGTGVDTATKLLDKFTELESSLKDELNSLKVSMQITKTELKAMNQRLRHVEQERDVYREGLGKVRDELNETRRDIRVLEEQARSHARMLRSGLNGTIEDLSNARQIIDDLKLDVTKLNISWVTTEKDLGKVHDELNETRRGINVLEEQARSHARMLRSDLNGTIEDLSNARQIIDDLKQDVTMLTTCCVVRNETVPGPTTASTDPSQDPSLSTTVPPVTTQVSDQRASTDPNQHPSLSTTVPPVTVTTQDPDQHASTDPNQHPSLSTTVPPVTTQDPDQHATPSAATGYDLWYASWDGDLETVRRIVAAGRVDVNYRGRRSMTPVMAAARRRRRDVVEFLVGEGANLSLVDEDGNNILHWACYGGHLETVKLIVSLNVADVNSRGQSSWTPVMRAARYGRRDVVEFLVGEGADLSLVDMFGNNALHVACGGGDLETVKLMLSLDVVDINARNNYGQTAADRARYSGHQRVVDLLVSRGGTLSW